MTTAKNDSLESVLERLYGKLHIGDVLKEHRKADDISLAKMAKKLEIGKEKLEEIENNHYVPSLSTVKKASKILNLSFKTLEDLLRKTRSNTTYIAVSTNDFRSPEKISQIKQNLLKNSIETVVLHGIKRVKIPKNQPFLLSIPRGTKTGRCS